MAYLGKTPSQAVRSRYYFTASGGETSLSGADDNTNTLTFTDGNYVDVSLNGVALVAGTDYNTTTANTIGGLTALVASDVVEVIVYDTFSVFGGEFRGDISLGDNVKAKFGASDDLQIYHDASDSIINDNGTGSLKLQTGGSTKLEVTSTGIDVTGRITTDAITEDTSGNVGIGTTSPSEKVHVAGIAKADNGFLIGNSYLYEGAVDQVNMRIGTDGPYLEFIDVGSNVAEVGNASGPLALTSSGTERMRIDSSGNVGIGTTSPNSSYKMTIESTASEAGIRVQGDNARVAVWENGSSTIGDGPNFYMQNISGGTYAASMQMGAASEILFFQYPNAGAWYERMRIDSSGNLLVGTTSTSPNPGVALQPIGNVGIGNSNGNSGVSFLEFRRNATQIGGVTQSGTTGVSYNTSSDHRLKENVTDVTDGITRVKQLEPKRFNFIADPDRTVDGFLAHEAQAVVPEAVTGTHNEVDDDGNAVMQGIDQSKLVPLLTAALKEAITKIETLETEMTSVKARLDALEAN